MTKPTEEEMIDKINLVIANKELSFWCRMIMKDCDWDKHNVQYINEDFVYYENWNTWWYEEDWVEKIIWHKVMIWDVLDWISGFWEWGFTVWWDGVIDMWQWQWKFNFRKPIEEQSEECIEYIYSLIQEND